MAGFHTKTFLKHDDYCTPKYVWENISEIIPKDMKIWECFYCDGLSGTYLREIGCNDVIHEPIDFFENNIGDILISNPPFSKKKEVYTRLKELDKPFIMISPSSMINTQYIRELFSNSEYPLQIIIPRKRINFTKKINGVIPENWGERCNFDCFYYCYKMNLENDINWLM
tara:strand:+ start:1335 stop:1844 length:510 start_codon:yes stop_codon:yes gene_type:complete